MSLRIERYDSAHVGGVRAFNDRLQAGGSRWRFPESPTAPWLPPRDGVPAWQEMHLAVDDDGVHGGYVAKPQTFWARGREVVAAHIQLPLSEGVVDPRYVLVGARLVRHAVQRHPLLFSLGLGSLDTPAARMLRTLGLEFVRTSFHFRVLKPNRFLRQIDALRTTSLRRRALDAAAASGLGWIGLAGLDTLTRPPWRRRRRPAPADAFGPWADLVWRESRHVYAFAGVRNAASLNAHYPPGDDRFVRLRTLHFGDVVGWSVVAATPMCAHRQFGDLHVGALVDCMALPGFERAVVADAEAYLARRGVDLIVANQLHRSWRRAFGGLGYVRGPSNFYFGASRALVELLGPLDDVADGIHMTRGDGDGPVHLVPGFALSEAVGDPVEEGPPSRAPSPDTRLGSPA